MPYRTEATTVAGFIQQLAVGYVRNGYFFYVTGRVPGHKDPAAVDAKLVGRYAAGLSKWARARRKGAGAANTQYLRHDRFFVLLSTHGEGTFFAEEGGAVRDVRRVPIKYAGYAVGYSGGHVQVRIERGRYLSLKAHLCQLATRRTAEEVARAVRDELRFEPYAPVRSQSLAVLRAVNQARALAGLPEVPRSCLRFRRRVVRPFDHPPERDDGGCKP
jgi:hypothetical protein